MATPTISTAGTASKLMLITDKDGVSYRVPIATLAWVSDTSSGRSYRLDVSTSRGDIILIYASSAEVTTALAAIDALY